MWSKKPVSFGSLGPSGPGGTVVLSEESTKKICDAIEYGFTRIAGAIESKFRSVAGKEYCDQRISKEAERIEGIIRTISESDGKRILLAEEVQKELICMIKSSDSAIGSVGRKVDLMAKNFEFIPGEPERSLTDDYVTAGDVFDAFETAKQEGRDITITFGERPPQMKLKLPNLPAQSPRPAPKAKQ